MTNHIRAPRVQTGARHAIPLEGGYASPVRKSSLRPSLCGAATAGLLSGCLVGPDFVAPEPPAVPAWSSPLDHGLTADPSPETLATWWTNLGDSKLVELELRAAEANKDLAVAAARLREARAQRKGARAGLFPTATGSGSASRTRSSSSSFGGLNPPDPVRDLYDVGFDASWEIDLFGGLRRGVEAATADLAASEADLQGVHVSVAAEVAETYIDLRSLQQRLQLAEANLASQTETVDIASWRAQAGLTTDLDVQQARASLEQTRAAIPQLRTAIAASLARLAVLVGQPPGALDPELAAPQPIPVPPPQIAVGVPADALTRRPDVTRAVAALHAETARIGVAKAEYYPHLSLTGELGARSLDVEDLFTAGARTSSLVGQLTQVIFDFGRIRASIQAQEAFRDASLADLEQTLLLALEESENALVAYAQEQERRDALQAASAAAEQAASLSRQQYSSGLVDFESVIVAERTMVSAQDQLAESEGTLSSNLVRIYKALGGGWSPGNVP